ncbi:MAG: hypothetical protein ACLR1T_17925 [Evtepia gabavorous]
MGTITLFVSMLVMMFLFDWRMGAACLLAAVISVRDHVLHDGGQKRQTDGGVPGGPGPHDQGEARVRPGHPGGQDFPADGLLLQGFPAGH